MADNQTQASQSQPSNGTKQLFDQFKGDMGLSDNDYSKFEKYLSDSTNRREFFKSTQKDLGLQDNDYDKFEKFVGISAKKEEPAIKGGVSLYGTEPKEEKAYKPKDDISSELKVGYAQKKSKVDIGGIEGLGTPIRYVPKKEDIEGIEKPIEKIDVGLKLDTGKQVGELELYKDKNAQQVKEDLQYKLSDPKYREAVRNPDGSWTYNDQAKENVNKFIQEYVGKTANPDKTASLVNDVIAKNKDYFNFYKIPAKTTEELYTETQREEKPEPSYLGGITKIPTYAMSAIAERLDAGGQIVSDIVNKVAGKKILPDVTPQTSWKSKVEEAGKYIPEAPEGVAGEMIKSVGNLAPLIVESTLPIGVVSKGITFIPKIATAMGSDRFLTSYLENREKGIDAGSAARIAAEEGAGDLVTGLAFEATGHAANKITELSKFLQKEPVLKSVVAATANATGFGGFNAIEQYVKKGEVDKNEVLNNFMLPIVMHSPQVAGEVLGALSDGRLMNKIIENEAKKKAIQEFFTNKDIDVSYLKDVDVKALREEADKLSEKISSEKDEKKREEYILAQGNLNKIADVYGVSKDVVADPEKYRQSINNNPELNDNEKKYLIGRIDQVVVDSDPKLKQANDLGKQIEQLDNKIKQIDSNTALMPAVKEAQKNQIENQKKELLNQINNILKPEEYAIEEVKKPSGVQAQPETRVEGGEIKETGVSDSVRGAAEGEEKVIPAKVETEKVLDAKETDTVTTQQGEKLTIKQLRDSGMSDEVIAKNYNFQLKEVPKTIEATKAQEDNRANIVSVTPMVMYEGKPYYGADHGKAIEEVLKVDPNAKIDRNQEGMFEIVDNKGNVEQLNRNEAQDKYGFNQSHLIPENLFSETPKEVAPKEVPDTLKDVESTAKALEKLDEEKLNKIGSPIKQLATNIQNKYFGLTIKDENNLLINNKEYANLFEKDEAGKITDSERKRMNDIYKEETKKVASQKISEAYHKAKADGSNPELVKAVEDLLGKAPMPEGAKVEGEQIPLKDGKSEEKGGKAEGKKEDDVLITSAVAAGEKPAVTPADHTTLPTDTPKPANDWAIEAGFKGGAQELLNSFKKAQPKKYAELKAKANAEKRPVYIQDISKADMDAFLEGKKKINDLWNNVKKYNSLGKRARKTPQGIKLLSDIKNAAKDAGLETYTSASSGMLKVSKKGKTIRPPSVPRSKEAIQEEKQIKEERKKLLKKEPNNLREWIYQYILSGGKVNIDDYVANAGKEVPLELRRSINKNGLSFHDLWVRAGEDVPYLTPEDNYYFDNAIADAISDIGGWNDLYKELKASDISDVNKMLFQEANALGINLDEIQDGDIADAIDAADKISEEEWQSIIKNMPVDGDLETINNFIEEYGIEEPKGAIDSEVGVDVFEEKPVAEEEKPAAAPEEEIITAEPVAPVEEKPVVEKKPIISDETKAKIADGLEGIISKWGGIKKLTGEERTALWDDFKKLFGGLIDAGGESAKYAYDQIRNALSKIPSITEEDKSFFETKISGEPKVEAKKEIEVKPGEVKKTVAGFRAYEGEIRQGVKDELEKLGLTREVRNQAESQSAAKQFIDKVGEEAALDAIKSGDVKNGDSAAFIYAEVIDRINNRLATETDPAVIEDLNRIQASLINTLGETATYGGQFNAALNRIYQESDLGYNVEKKISDYKAQNNGVIPAAVEAKFRELDTQLQEVKKKLVDAEKRAKEAEEQASVNAIKESIDRQKGKEKKIEAATKQLANKIRKGKLSRPGVFSAATPGSIVWDTAIETVAKTVETTGKVAQAVADGLKIIKDSDWYKGLTKEKQKESEQAYLDFVKSYDDVTDGKLKISKQTIRDLVESGVTDINDLTKAVMDMIKEEYPDATEREVRDAITGYGQRLEIPKDEISRQIRKMKNIGRILSALEDIAEKKRPLKSGLQRDKLDAEERMWNKKLREEMKELPVTDELLSEQLKTATDAAKQRIQNQIEDLEREIATNEKIKKKERLPLDDEELKKLKEKRDALKSERDALFKNEEEEAQQRLSNAKKAAQKRIEELQTRLKNKDFSKKTFKKAIEDTELSNLRAEKIRLKDEYDKEFYKNELENRTKGQKRIDAFWEAWGLTRALRATADLSFVGVQGLIPTISALVRKPSDLASAFREMVKFMGSEKYSEDWLRKIRAQSWYPELKQSKLSLTEPSAKLTAREESTYSGWANNIWNIIGLPIKAVSKSAFEKWKKANVMRSLERASVGYLDTLRVLRFLDGTEMLKKKGITFESNPKAYREMADVINTFSGRASLGNFERFSETLSKVFFSPRNWASTFKTASPYAFYHFGKMRAGAKGWKPSVAQKIAIGDYSRFLGLTTGMVALATAYLNNDDDDKTGVELDPTSSDFLKIKIGDKRIDPWGGRIQEIVLTARLLEGSLKKQSGEVYKLGTPYKTPTREGLIMERAINKLAPSASILEKYLSSGVNKKGETIDKYGNKFELTEEVKNNLYPIYFETVYELLKDDPTALDGFLTFYTWLGGNVQIYKESKKGKKSTYKIVSPSESKETEMKGEEIKTEPFSIKYK